MAKIWRFFLLKLDNRIAVVDFIKDSTKVIRHGYMDLEMEPWRLMNVWSFVPLARYTYSQFKKKLEWGDIPDYRERPKDREPSSFYTLRKYFKNLPHHFDEPELYTAPLYSYQEIAKQWEDLWT